MEADIQNKITPELLLWFIESHMRDIAPELIEETLNQHGLSSAMLTHAMVMPMGEAMLWQAGKRISDELKRTEWLLRVAEYNHALLSEHRGIERRKKLGRKEFLLDHYAANQPVILTDCTARWPARKKWTFTALKKHYGDMQVEFTKTHPDGAVMCKTYEQARFQDFLETVEQAGYTNDYYLTSYNNERNLPLVFAMIKDIGRLPQYLDPSLLNPNEVYPWIGPAGTHTGLHIDASNALLCQMVGRKQVKLVAPHHMPHLYLNNDFFSPVNLHDPDMARYPKASFAKVHEVTLHPGEALFIPVGWWHQVVALDVSVSVTLTNFAFPNNYPPISQVFPTVRHDAGKSLPRQEADEQCAD